MHPKWKLSLHSALFSLALLSGCTEKYIPRPRPAEEKLVSAFPPGSRVALINNQPSQELRRLGEIGMGSTGNGDMHAWTEQAVLAIKTSLERAGAVVDPHADRSLKISITRANVAYTSSGFGFNADGDFTVELGDGRSFPLTAQEGSWKWQPACDELIMRIASTTLQHSEIRGYISGK
ncbi:MAG: hypothetical protein IT581_04165 [Verrucomicrobiales bacterium]|nr:hypothetical protein [Verrucomicrobiales bacterium]